MARRYYRKRKAPIEDVFDVLFEIIEIFSVVGAVISFILFPTSLYYFGNAFVRYNTQSTNIIETAFPWINFVFPAFLFIIASIIGLKTWQAFNGQNYR